MIAKCEWPVGTVYTGPRQCGRPVKAVTFSVYPWSRESTRVEVCGIHANKAERYGWVVDRAVTK